MAVCNESLHSSQDTGLHIFYRTVQKCTVWKTNRDTIDRIPTELGNELLVD